MNKVFMVVTHSVRQISCNDLGCTKSLHNLVLLCSQRNSLACSKIQHSDWLIFVAVTLFFPSTLHALCLGVKAVPTQSSTYSRTFFSKTDYNISYLQFPKMRLVMNISWHGIQAVMSTVISGGLK